jgi:hypothetical protein
MRPYNEMFDIDGFLLPYPVDSINSYQRLMSFKDILDTLAIMAHLGSLLQHSTNNPSEVCISTHYRNKC